MAALLRLALGWQLVHASMAYHDGFHLGAYVMTEHGMWFPEYQMGNLDWGRVRACLAALLQLPAVAQPHCNVCSCWSSTTGPRLPPARPARH